MMRVLAGQAAHPDGPRFATGTVNAPSRGAVLFDDRNLLSCHWPSGIIGRVGAGCGVMTGGSAFQRRLATNTEFTNTSTS